MIKLEFTIFEHNTINMKFLGIWGSTFLLFQQAQIIIFAQESGNTFININNSFIDESTVIINEILTSNTTILPDQDFGLYRDWIELFNNTDMPIQLGGYYLTDDSLETTKWQIPNGTELASNTGMIIWADGKDLNDRELHTNFKLSKEGEWLGLFSPDQEQIDNLLFLEQENDVSFGKTTDGLKYFGTPTPGKKNQTWQSDRQEFTGIPEYSLKGGFYSGSQTIVLSSSEPNLEIRYTFNGSVPDINSNLYEAPFIVDSTIVVKARAFKEGFLPSKVVTKTYFIDEKTSLPVFSISTDPKNLWDDNIGIYTMGSNGLLLWGVNANYWQDWERPTHIEFFEDDKKLTFSMNAGIAINGARRNTLQKSFRIFARDKYGDPLIQHKIFPFKPINEFTSLILRNGGYPEFRHTMFRDGMMQELLTDEMDIDKQSYRPAVVFINGEYFGIYNIREKQNEDYLYYNHGVDPTNIDLLEKNQTIVEGDRDHYKSMFEYINIFNISDPAVYDSVKSLMDVEEYINYQISEIYFANIDWPANNIKYWRPKTPGGKWRWMMFDVEAGFQLWGKYDHNSIEFATDSVSTEWNNAPWSTFLLRTLLKNNEFKNEFVQKFALHLNTTFKPERVKNFIDSLKGKIAGEIPAHIERWAIGCSQSNPESYDGCTFPSVAAWESNVEIMNVFAENRPEYITGFINDKFGLFGLANITFKTEEMHGGTIKVFNKAVTNSEAVTKFYKNIPIEIEAVPAAGYGFAGWEGVSGIDSSSAIITVNSDTIITALFTPLSEIVIPSLISENLTLKNLGVPYSSNGDIIIDTAATLTVEKGIEIQMPDNGSIYVFGKLLINGTNDEPITISPKFEEEQKRWGAICFDNANGKSVLQHVKIIGATLGKHPINQKAAISSYNSDIVLDFIEMENVDFPIFIQFGSVSLTNSKITTDVTSDFINVKLADAIVENCNLLGNDAIDTDAIDYDGVIDGIIRGNKIYNFSGYNSDGIDLGEGAENILVEKNFIHDCQDKGISIGQASSAIITNNVIINCDFGIGAKDSNSYALVDHNTFFNNNVGVAAFEKTSGRGGATLDVINTIIANSNNVPYSFDNHSNIDFSYSINNNESLPGDTNITADPLFTNPQQNDFRILLGSPAIDSGDPDSPLDPDGSRTNIGAYFYDFDGKTNIVINEINYHSMDNFNPMDWVELYNPKDTAIDLSNWIFKDSKEDHIFKIPNNTNIEKNEHIILCEDTTQFRLFFQETGAYLGNLNFALSNSGETIRLFDNIGNLIDFVTYSDSLPWATEPDGSGATLGLLSYELDNSLAENWCGTLANGTPGYKNIFLDTSDTIETTPTKYVLSQNYPNPFNSKTAFEFELPQNDFVTIEVFDLLGRMVATVTEKEYTTGVFKEYFNAQHLASGVYFYRLQTQNGVIINKKMVLLK
ncbi:MAG: CotH kinase family protein [Melioribacteraceae bacterium]|jgi:hypothetical protein|nr:CotH kinase family protein [Melioribacteraceae bacterium]